MSSHSHCSQAPLQAPGDVVQAARALHCCQGLGPLPLQFGLGGRPAGPAPGAARHCSSRRARRRAGRPQRSRAGGPAAAQQAARGPGRGRRAQARAPGLTCRRGRRGQAGTVTTKNSGARNLSRLLSGVAFIAGLLQRLAADPAVSLRCEP